MAQEKIKTCICCGESLVLSEFYRHPRMADGRLGKCKECVKSAVRNNRRKNIEYYREFDRNRSNLPHRVLARKEYAKTEAGLAARRKGSSAWARRNPKKRKAQIAVGNAIRDGRLIPLPCEVCFNTHDIQAHHDDYNKPLEVRWLCAKHHKEVHANMPQLKHEQRG